MIKTVKLTDAIQFSKDWELRKPLVNFQQIDLARPLDYAMLRTNSEYFWVKVDAINPFVGIVENEITFAKNFEQGDKIYFEDKNIFDLRSREWKNNEHI